MTGIKKQVLLIGCGPSGLAFLAAMRNDAIKLRCYEKQNVLGGLWNYNWNTFDESAGELSPNPMYDNLWTNTPKEVMQLSDYTMLEHFGKPVPSFLPRVAYLDYLQGLSKKYELERFVKFNHAVRQVTENENGRFAVVVEDLKKGCSFNEVYDHVLVATSHFSTPHYPTVEGMETFTGRVLHSRDFRFAQQFHNQNVLIIGGNVSADDISKQLLKYGNKNILVSYKTRPNPFKIQGPIKEVPQCVKIEEGNICRFVSGEEYKADVIIFATGYRHHYPFMSEPLRLRIKLEDHLFPPDLYKGVLLHRQPNVAYLCAQGGALTAMIADAQAHYMRDYILGVIEIEQSEQREADIKMWQAKLGLIRSAKDIFYHQGEYVVDLKQWCSWTQENPLEIRDAMLNLFEDKIVENETFRDQSCKGAPLPEIKWMRQFDDSLETFLGQ